MLLGRTPDRFSEQLFLQIDFLLRLSNPRGLLLGVDKEQLPELVAAGSEICNSAVSSNQFCNIKFAISIQSSCPMLRILFDGTHRPSQSIEEAEKISG